MANNAWDAVWQRLRSGKHMAVIGPRALPPAPSDLKVFSVNCEVLGTSGNVMDGVLRKLEQLLGEALRPAEPVPASRTLEGLVQAAGRTRDPSADSVRSALQELEQQLAQAESVLGRLAPPDDMARSV